MVTFQSRHTCDRIIEGLLGKVAGLIRGVKNFIVEHGEIEGKTEADRMRRSKVGLGNLGSVLVGLQRLIGRLLALVSESEFGKVAVVIALPVEDRHSSEGRPWEVREESDAHLVVEDLGFTTLSGGNQVLVENLQDIFTDLGKLILDLLAVFLDESNLSFISLGLLLLLDGSDDSPGSTPRSDDVLVGD